MADCLKERLYRFLLPGVFEYPFPELLLELVFEVFIFSFTSVISTESPLVP